MINLLLGSLASAQTDTPQADTLPPLTDLQVENYLPFLIEFDFVSRRKAEYYPISQKDADKHYNDAVATAKELLNGADKTALDSLYSNYQKLSDLYQFFAKIGFSATDRQKVSELRELLYQTGEWIHLKENDPKKRAHMKISYLALGLGRPAYRADAIAELVSLRDQAPRRYRNPLALLVFYNLSSAENTLDSAKSAIKKVYSSFNNYEKQIVALVRTRNAAGIVGNQKVGAPQDNLYDRLLRLSRYNQKSRYAGIQGRVQATILDTWIQTRENVDWRQVPLMTIAEDGRKVSPPIRERLVLEAIAEGNLTMGLKTYEELASTFAGQPVVMQIDRRRLDLQKSLAQKSGRYDTLQSFYLELIKKYRQDKSLEPKQSRKMAIGFFRDYQNYVLDRLKQAQGVNVPTDQRLLAMKMGQFLLANFGQHRSAVKPVKEELAKVYKANSRFKEAVSLYIDLAKNEPLVFLPKAIETQIQVAGWKSKPPWANVQKTARRERQVLVKLINAYFQQQKKKEQQPDWRLLAHLGLLYRNLGQAAKAETLWREHLPRATSSDPSHGAVGILLESYYRQKKWADLIEVFRLAEEKSISPTWQAKPINSARLYQVALLKRAQQFQQQQKPEQALADYSAFAQRFTKDRRRPYALYQMAQMQRQLDRVDQAVNTVTTILQEYPNHALTKRVMLEGASWARAADDENLLNQAVNLLSKYVENYPSEINSTKARWQLAQVQLQLGRKDEAAQHFKQHSLDKRVEQPQRVQSALKYISLEAEFGDMAQAMTEVKSVLEKAQRSNEQNFISAHVILARMAAEKLDQQKMMEEEAILLPQAEKRQDAAEALGLLRFNRAENMQLEIPFPQGTETVDSYRATVESIYQSFIKASQVYDKVCQPAENSHCFNSYRRTKQLAQDAMDAIGSIMVDDQIAQDKINHLKSLQQAHIKKLREFFEYYRKMATKFEDYEAPDLVSGIVRAH
jgi:tetratricopeptide (TPR) repeat protein